MKKTLLLVLTLGFVMNLSADKVAVHIGNASRGDKLDYTFICEKERMHTMTFHVANDLNMDNFEFAKK